MSDGEQSETPHNAETKIVRTHEEDKGQYVYLMLTRFNGEGAILGREGWGGDYIWFSTVSRNADANVSGADAWTLSRRYPANWFGESVAAELMKAIDMDKIAWDGISDNDHLTAEDVAALKGDSPEIRTDGGHTPLRKLDHSLQDALYALANFEGEANQSHVEAYLGRETRTARAKARDALRNLIKRDLVAPSGDHKAQFCLTDAGKATVRQDAQRRISVAEKLDSDVDVTDLGELVDGLGGSA